MENRIDEILEADIVETRKASLLSIGAREAFDRGLIELSKEYKTAFEALKSRTDNPFRSQDPHSQNVFYANKPQVIIFKEKHDDWIFDASTPENAARACLKVIEYRLKDEYWYSDELSEEEDPGDQLNMFSSNKFPLTEVGQVRRILEIAREPTGLIVGGKMAFNFLMKRSDYEYEHVEVEIAEVAEFT